MALESVKSGILSSFHYKTNLFSIESGIVEALFLREKHGKTTVPYKLISPTSMSQLHRSELEKAWHEGVTGQCSALSLPIYPSPVWLSSPEVTFLLFEKQGGLTQRNHEWRQPGPHDDTWRQSRLPGDSPAQEDYVLRPYYQDWMLMRTPVGLSAFSTESAYAG